MAAFSRRVTKGDVEPAHGVIAAGRAIRDAIGCVAAQPLAGRILEDSLAAAGIGTVPSDAASLHSFVREHLIEACAARAGAAAAVRLEETLQPLLESIARGGDGERAE